MYVKGHCGCIQMHCVHMQIYVYISGFVGVRICVYIYTYMYEKTLCVQARCVHTNTGIHVCVCILYSCVLNVCVGIYIYIGIHNRPHGRIQIHCVRIGIHTYVSVFVHVCSCIHMYTYIYEKTPCVHTNLRKCVCMFTYMNAAFTCGCIHF